MADWADSAIFGTYIYQNLPATPVYQQWVSAVTPCNSCGPGNGTAPPGGRGRHYCTSCPLYHCTPTPGMEAAPREHHLLPHQHGHLHHHLLHLWLQLMQRPPSSTAQPADFPLSKSKTFCPSFFFGITLICRAGTEAPETRNKSLPGGNGGSRVV